MEQGLYDKPSVELSQKGGLYVGQVVSYGHVKVQKFAVGKFTGDISWTWRFFFFFFFL